MQQMIEKIKKKVQSGELFKVKYKSTPVDYEMNQLKSINIEEAEGWALRVIHDGKIGFSSSTSQNQIDGMTDKAIEVAKFGQEALFEFPEIVPAPKKNPALYDLSVQEKTVEEMIETGNKIVKKIHSINKDFRCDAGITKHTGNVEYRNTNGGSFNYQKTIYSQGVMVQDTKENDMMMLMESQQWGNSSAFSLDDLFERIERKVKWGENVVEMNSGNIPAIFTPKALLVLMLPLISGLNGKMVNKKISPLQDKKGQNLWSSLLSLYSDGIIDFAGGSAPYDDEGIPMQRLPLIKKGILKNFYYDLQNAAEAGTKPTGNGIRPSFHSSPSPGISNLIMPKGKTSLKDMIKDIKEGIIIDQVLGLGQGNVLSGAFSNNVQLGFKIQDGKVAGRIKNVMISGNALEVLKDIVAVGNESRWVSGQYCFPHVYVKSLSVSTKV